MRRRIEDKLRKAIRRREHHHKGLLVAIRRRERSGSDIRSACLELVLDGTADRGHRMFIAALFSRRLGDAIQIWLAVAQAALRSDGARLKAEILNFCSNRTRTGRSELDLLRCVLATGTLDEQMSAIDGLAFIRSRPVRRALIQIAEGRGLPLEVRERALEMLHLQPSRETVDYCTSALSAPEVSLRFWAAYTLGQLSFFRGGLRVFARAALMKALEDREVAPGWWSVRREAQALLAGLRDDPAEQEHLQAEIRRIQADGNSSPEDRGWANFYSRE